MSTKQGSTSPLAVRALTALALVLALGALGGCAAIERAKARRKVNPRYRGEAAAALLPIHYAPVIGCPSSRPGIEPNESARRTSLGIVVPDLLAGFGAADHPGFAPRNSQPGLCNLMLRDGGYPGWDGNEVLRQAADEQLAGTDANSVLLLMLSMMYRCEDIYEDVLSPDGRTVVGRLRRGERCYETGELMLMAILASREGEIAWHSGALSHDDSIKEFFLGWPGPRDPPPASATAAHPASL